MVQDKEVGFYGLFIEMFFLLGHSHYWFYCFRWIKNQRKNNLFLRTSLLFHVVCLRKLNKNIFTLGKKIVLSKRNQLFDEQTIKTNFPLLGPEFSPTGLFVLVICLCELIGLVSSARGPVRKENSEAP